jgi:AAA+ superfamily predicted ATPase
LRLGYSSIKFFFIGPEFGTVSRPDLVAAAREAGDAGFDVLITCAFNYDAHSSDFDKLGRIPVLKARMNADLHMTDDLKNTGKGNLFVIFGEPDIDILDAEDNRIQVKINGVDVFHPNTGEVKSDNADGIACWFIDTDYNEESFFVRHAYFLGANDPYKALKTTLKAEIDKEAWDSLNIDLSRPFDRPASGRIAVKVINHLGDESLSNIGYNAVKADIQCNRTYQRRDKPMARADHIKALLQSHSQGDDQRFYSVAMQVAALEARQGHGKLAQELRDLIDQAKKRKNTRQTSPIPIGRPRGELSDLLTVTYPKLRLSDMVLEDTLAQQIKKVIREQRHGAQLLSHGLSPARKLLLIGPPGNGKTMSASVLAAELGYPLFQIRLDGLLTKYMGETAAKLRQIFDAAIQTRGVYFFDEFDAIGSNRGMINDVGEIRRILNSFLIMIEQDDSHSLIIAATNHPGILDHALFRRFDDVLQYDLPDPSLTAALLKAKLSHLTADMSWPRLAELANGLSYAEITRAVQEALKYMLINKESNVTEKTVEKMLAERQNLRARLFQN